MSIAHWTGGFGRDADPARCHPDERDRRAAEAVGFLMLWNGAMGTLLPVDHCLAFRGGPQWWGRTMDWFVARPALTRSLALAEFGGGLWLTLRNRRRAAAHRYEPVS